MRTVLVNSPVEVVREKGYDTPDYPNPSLAPLATYLRHSGEECAVVDAKLEGLLLDSVLARIQALSPDFVGFTAFTHEISHVAEIARRVRHLVPGATTIIGGAHATALPERTLEEFPVFDVAVFGEGEVTLLQLVSRHRPLESIKGLAWRKDGAIIRNEPRPFIENLDDLPDTDWSLFPKARIYPIFTSRGCPFNCVFCSRPFGRKLRTRSPQRILGEMGGIIQDFGVRSFLFWDEAFGLDVKKTDALLDGLISEPRFSPITWNCQTNVNVLSPSLIGKMKAAGCGNIGIGVESGDEDILSHMGKGVTLPRIVAAANSLRAAGMPFSAFFILGHPNETVKTINSTINFAVKLNPNCPVFGIMVPYPGTEIYRMAQSGEGGYLLLSRDWGDFNKQMGKALELKGVSRRTLELMQVKAYFSVFLRNGRFRDLLRYAVQYRREFWSLVVNFIGRRRVDRMA